MFRSLWQDKSDYYYVFGFLTVVSMVLIVTIVEVTIVATYVQLCAEVRLSTPFSRFASLTWTELPLVVAIFLHRRWQRHLGLPLLRVVLFHEAPYLGLHFGHAVLQLQSTGVRRLRLADGDGGLPGCVCIREAYLRVSGR